MINYQHATTVWRVLKRRLHTRPYRLQLVQVFRAGDKEMRVEFCDAMLHNTEGDSFLPRLIFSDEVTFHLTGKVNSHNVLTWGIQNPRQTVEHARDSPKVNAFCATPKTKALLDDCISKCCGNGSFHNLMKIPMT
jgi:hypothetical protein